MKKPIASLDDLPLEPKKIYNEQMVWSEALIQRYFDYLAKQYEDGRDHRFSITELKNKFVDTFD